MFATGVSLAEQPKGDEISEELTQRTWLLAKALELPVQEPFWTPGELRAAVEELLARRLSFLADSLPASTRVDVEDVPLGEFLEVPPRAIESLRTIKDWAKQEFSLGEAGTPPTVVSADYFCALCAALTDHGERLSRLSDEALQTSVDALLESEWIPEVCRRTLSATGPSST